MAERVGFEPTCPCGQDAFEAPPLRPLRYLSVSWRARVAFGDFAPPARVSSLHYARTPLLAPFRSLSLPLTAGASRRSPRARPLKPSRPFVRRLPAVALTKAGPALPLASRRSLASSLSGDTLQSESRCRPFAELIVHDSARARNLNYIIGSATGTGDLRDGTVRIHPPERP
jgi:hypothetical protein